MIENQLNNENYHSTEMRKIYMGSSQFKDFLKCEKEALAKVNGEIEEESSEALLFGSYVDAYFSHELEQFTKEHLEMFNSKTGELKACYKNVEEVISAIENDELMMKCLNGQHQVIMTGEIAGVPFKIKIDSYHPGKYIIDQKIMKDLDYVWVEKDGKNVKVDFIEGYGYDIQGAIYQEIVRQNTGLKLPFILAVTTKEKNPDKVLIEIDQEYLDKRLDLVKELAPRYNAIKQGTIKPNGCGKCSVCRKAKKVLGIQSYKKLFHNTDNEIEY